eukprot:m.1637261 g.1637261  ORF g.1637261 m.1637261 type:complete len:170 (-) comp25621_c0_seq1:226-735(-)
MTIKNIVCIAAVLAFSACMAPTTTALPVVVAEPNSSCLTPAQGKALNESVKAIHDLFSTAIFSLDVAYAAEKDPKIKANLKIAITVLSAVDIDIVANLTKIAEEACPTCSSIIKVIKDSVSSIEETLNRVDPNWDNNPIFKAVVELISALLNIINDFCPTATDTTFAVV